MQRLPLALVGLALVACSDARSTSGAPIEAAERPMPQPTEHRLDDDAEARHKAARKRWIAEMHRADEGVDWRAIERANGLAEQERRTAAVRSFAPMPPSHWGEVGSSNQAGRMHCATISPDGQTLYAGSSLGGLWRGTLQGASWTPLGDNLFGGAHDVLALPGESVGAPDVLLVTTDGGKVSVSRDQGASWEAPTGLGNLNSVRGVAVLNDASSTILIGGRVGSSARILASTDYGRTFTTRFQDSINGLPWMWVPRVGPGAASHVYFANAGRVRVSTDGGFTFGAPTTVASGASDAVLTGSEAGAPTLYAAFRSGGSWTLYRSDNAGASFTAVQGITDFWRSLCASIHDPNLVVYGGVEVWRSGNGGGSFAKINGWGEYYGDPANKLHADTPGLYCVPNPTNPSAEIWYVCTDGGLYESSNGGLAPSNLSLSGLGVSQYYSTHTSVSNPNLILAGAQDQGYQRGTYQAPTGSGPSTPFSQLISGDYGHMTSSDGTHGLVYSVYPGFVLVQEGQSSPSLLYPWTDFPAGSSHLWLPPIVADPLSATTFFFCADALYRYDRVSGPNWNYVQHSAQDFTVGGGSYMSAMRFAPSDSQRAYAATNAGRLFWSDDHGVTWTQGSTSGPGNHYFYGNALTVHPTDADEVAVGGSGYSNPGVWRSTDGGQTWTPESSGLPQTLVYSLTYAPDGSGDLYAGTETGAWHWDRDTGTWDSILQNQTPITIYWSVETVGADIVRYGTYGRGIWDYTIPPETGPNYCTAGTTTNGCTATMAQAGTPSASAGSGFTLAAEGVEGQKQGLIFYGISGPLAAPWGTSSSWRCVKSPVQRTPASTSGGTVGLCDGALSIDFNWYVQWNAGALGSPWSVGQQVWAQAWFRDPPSPETTNLSDGTTFQVGP